MRISLITVLWLLMVSCPFALCREDKSVGPKSCSLRFRFDSRSKGTIQENIGKSTESKQSVSTSTVFEYTLRRTVSDIEVLFHQVSLKTVQDGRETSNIFMSRNVYRSKKNDQWEVIQADEADSKLRRMLNDSFESPICRITVDKDNKEIKRVYLARIGAMSIINEKIIANARIFHAPFPKGNTRWTAPVAIPTGGGGTAKGILTYEVIKSGPDLPVRLVPVKVSGEASHERKTKKQVLKTHYNITGKQMFDTKLNEWVEGNWQILLTFDLYQNGRKEGTSSLTMTNILSLVEDPEKDTQKYNITTTKRKVSGEMAQDLGKTAIDYSLLSHHLSLQLKCKGWVEDVCFSPNGDRIASTDKDGLVRIWDTKTGTCTIILKCGTKHINDVCFSPDGRLVASGDEWSKIVKIWNSFTGQCVQTIKTEHRKNLHDLCFSPDGKYLVSASDDKTLKLWDVNNGSLVKTFKGHKAGVFCVAFSPNGRHIASGSWDHTIKLWNVKTGEVARTFKGHSSTIESLAFSADGNHIASCEWFGDKVIIWNVPEGYPESRKHLLKPKCVGYSPAGNYLAIGDAYGQIHMMDTKSGMLIRKFKAHEKFLAPVVEVNAVQFSPDGKQLVSAADDKKLKVWSFK